MNKTRTIFEGTVNGEKFDNINAYNARIIQLMDSGQLLSASSSTRVEDITKEVEGVNEVIKKIEVCDEKPKAAVKKYLPASDDNSKYIDDVLQSENVQKSINTLVDNLYELSEEVIANIPHNTKEQLDVYFNAACDAQQKLIRDLELTNNAICSKDDKLTKIENEVKELTKRLSDLRDEHESLVRDVTILDNAYQVIDTYIDFYDKVITEVNEAIEILESNECHCGGKCKCGCNGECKCGNHEDHCQCENVKTDIKEIKPQYVSNISKLIDEVFGF